MLQYAQVLEEGVLLQRSSSAAAFYLNRVMVIAQDAADGSLGHLKAISFCALQFIAASPSSLADQVSQPVVKDLAGSRSFSNIFQNVVASNQSPS